MNRRKPPPVFNFRIGRKSEISSLCMTAARPPPSCGNLLDSYGSFILADVVGINRFVPCGEDIEGMMLNTPIRRLRLIGFVEGVSYLVLLGIAMPLKYLAGMPLAVRVVGSLHGALFLLFFAAVAEVAVRRVTPSPGLWMRAIVASLVPCGTFVFDGWLKRVEIADEINSLEHESL